MFYIKFDELLENKEIKELFESVNWIRKNRDWTRLNNALKNSTLISIRNENNKLIGLCSILNDGLNAIITFLLIDPKYQNHKLGSLILDSVKREFNNYRIVVMTENAKDFYEQNGFNAISCGLEFDSTSEN